MKIRLDFVTNSSSSSYCVCIKKIANRDEDIIREIEEMHGFGRKGAEVIFNKFQKDNEDASKLSAYFIYQDSEDTDRPDVGDRLGMDFFVTQKLPQNKGSRSFKVISAEDSY